MKGKFVMKENETVEECMLRLQKEYDDRGKFADGVEGDQSAVVVELNDKWYARMTNGGNVLYVFFRPYKRGKDEIWRKAVVSGETLAEALSKLEKLCITMREKKAILIDPTSVEWE